MGSLFVAKDVASNGTAASAGGSPRTVSWSHTCTGINRLLMVSWCIGAGHQTAHNSALTATYNSVSMTLLGSQNSNNLTDGYVAMFALLNPASGSNTIAISQTSTDTGTAFCNGGAISYSNASGWGTAVTNFGSTSSATATVNGTLRTSLVCDTVGVGNAITASLNTQGFISNMEISSACGNFGMSNAPGGGNVSTTWNIGGSAHTFANVAVEIFSINDQQVLIEQQSLNRSYLW